MVLKGMYLYVIKTHISVQVVIPSYRQFSVDWHKMSITEEWGLLFATSNVLLNWNENFYSKQHRYVTNLLCQYATNYSICVQSYPITIYYVPLSCQCKYLLKCNIYNYCNMSPDQHRSHGPIFITCKINLHSIIKSNFEYYDRIMIKLERGFKTALFIDDTHIQCNHCD